MEKLWSEHQCYPHAPFTPALRRGFFVNKTCKQLLCDLRVLRAHPGFGILLTCPLKPSNLAKCGGATRTVPTTWSPSFTTRSSRNSRFCARRTRMQQTPTPSASKYKKVPREPLCPDTPTRKTRRTSD